MDHLVPEAAPTFSAYLYEGLYGAIVVLSVVWSYGRLHTRRQDGTHGRHRRTTSPRRSRPMTQPVQTPSPSTSTLRRLRLLAGVTALILSTGTGRTYAATSGHGLPTRLGAQHSYRPERVRPLLNPQPLPPRHRNMQPLLNPQPLPPSHADSRESYRSWVHIRIASRVQRVDPRWYGQSSNRIPCPTMVQEAPPDCSLR